MANQLRIMSTARKVARSGKRGKRPRLQQVRPAEFKATRKACGLTRQQAADLLGVSLRTVGHWETGAARCPYAAHKLLRVLRNGEFVHPAWDGFSIVRGKLVTPENHELAPGDLAWLTLLCRRAAAFSDLLREREGRAPMPAPAGTAAAVTDRCGVDYRQGDCEPGQGVAGSLSGRGFPAFVTVSAQYPPLPTGDDSPPIPLRDNTPPSPQGMIHHVLFSGPVRIGAGSPSSNTGMTPVARAAA